MIVEPMATADGHDLLRFRVLSESRRGVTHLVDLGENGERGRCSCEHFTTRLEGTGQRCKHIRAAGAFLLARTVRLLRRKEFGP